MTEEKNEEEKKTIKEEENTSASLIEQANAAAKRLEEGNKKLAELIEVQQQLQTEKTLSGKTNAGIEKQETEDEIAIKNARKMLEGTGMEDYAFPKEKEFNN